MANHKETCLSAAERVFDTRTVDYPNMLSSRDGKDVDG